MSAPSLPPNPPKNYSWVKPLAIWGSVGAAVVLGGYGIYTLLTNLTANQGINACEADWQTAFKGYITEYTVYYNANGKKPLTAQQEANLQPYVTAMNNAETCIQKLQNANTTDFWNSLTIIAVAAVAGTTLYGFFRAYLKRPGGPGTIQSGSEARNAARNSVVQEDADSGAIDAAEAADNVTANQAATQEEAATEEAALGDAADAQLAEAAGDEALTAQIEDFVSLVVDETSYYATLAYDYFIDLF